jgi:hypothetical protein
MYLAPGPPGYGYRDGLTTPRSQMKGKSNINAKALGACSFEPAAQQPTAGDHLAPEDMAAQIQFRADLWREYQIEAFNAGFNLVQATVYANALNSAMCLVVGVPEMAPIGRGWFYQSRARLVRRTVSSGLIRNAPWGQSQATGRALAAGAATLARGFRWWNSGGKA